MRLHAIVLADTHVQPGRKRHLPPRIYELLDDADVVLHAGDVVDQSLLDELSGFAKVHAVLGNNDRTLVLPETLELDLAGVRVAMIHDAGPTKAREGRLHRRFPDAALVVFGHSHIPWDREGIGGQRLFNPGSPTDRRTQPHHTAGLIDFEDGSITRHEIVRLD